MQITIENGIVVRTPAGVAVRPVVGQEMLESLPATSAGSPMRDLLTLAGFEVAGELELEQDGAESLLESLPGPASVDVPLSRHQDAVVLVERDGLCEWHLGQGAASLESRGGARLKTFAIPTPRPGPATEGAGGVFDFLFGKVKAYVLRFVASTAAELAVAWLERDQPTGWVRVSLEDRNTPFPRETSLPVPVIAGRRLRILLFLHGTFSSTEGSFGQLRQTDPGRKFLAEANQHYDYVLGWDHKTLSEDPRGNVSSLSSAFRELVNGSDVDLDVVTQSRGALVGRTFLEEVVPVRHSNVRIRRLVQTGATNGGTLLASPEHWKALADRTTTLVTLAARGLGVLAPGAAAAAASVAGVVGSVGSLIKHLASDRFTTRHVPGLAAMNPAGPFVRDLNATQPSQQRAVEADYRIIGSNFDMSAGQLVTRDGKVLAHLGLWAADAAVDALFQNAPSDLVVDLASMGRVDPGDGPFIKGRYDFPSNSVVHHLNYYSQPKVVELLSVWLLPSLKSPAPVPDSTT